MIGVAVLGSALVCGMASAQGVAKGTLALGLERLSGVFHAETDAVGPPTATDTLALLGSGGSTDSGAGVFQFPRLAFDGFVADGVSLGSSMTVLHRHQKQRDSYDFTTSTAFVVGPRLGFASMFSRVIGVWFRTGVSYSYFTTSPVEYTSRCISINLDFPIILRLQDHVAILIGPSLDAGQGQQRGDGLFAPRVSFLELGLVAGFAGLF